MTTANLGREIIEEERTKERKKDFLVHEFRRNKRERKTKKKSPHRSAQEHAELGKEDPCLYNVYVEKGKKSIPDR